VSSTNPFLELPDVQFACAPAAAAAAVTVDDACSTFSVESLLLDLVNASLSRRVTTQLAATTTSVAASTAGACL